MEFENVLLFTGVIDKKSNKTGEKYKLIRLLDKKGFLWQLLLPEEINVERFDQLDKVKCKFELTQYRGFNNINILEVDAYAE